MPTEHIDQLEDDNDEQDMFIEEDDGAEDLSRNQAAALLGVVPKTILRWSKQGLLKKNTRGRYPKAMVLALKNGPPDPTLPGEEPDLYGELTKGVGLANSHVERMFALIEKPLTVAVNSLLSTNEQYAQRIKEHDAAYLEMMKAYGEILMQKDEREAMQAREAVKTAMIANAAENVLPLIPVILGQLFAGKGNPNAVASAAKFLGTLTPEQKAQFAMMSGAFEGEQKAAFDAMLKDMGINTVESKEGEAAA